jgi:hypothetical protein
MTDDEGAGEGEPGVPDSDPDHLDPAGDMADLVEANVSDVDLDADTDAEDLRAFIDAAESGEFGPVDPGLEATVRIARALVEQAEDDDEDTDN